MFARPDSARVVLPITSIVKTDASKRSTDMEEEIREAYLSASGVASAVRDCLRGLFSESRLPDNPYLYLANQLGAYIDQSSLWQQSDTNISSSYDSEGVVEVLYPDTKICKHSGTNSCYGLPHVLRLVSKEAVEIMSRVLTDGLPDTFLPSSLPFSTNDGYEVQVMCSVQDFAALWRPSQMKLPELTVRSDIIVKGARLEEGVRIFIDQVLTDLEDIHQVPIYFVEGIAFTDAPSQVYEGGKEPFYQYFTLSDIYNKQEEFDKAALRLVLGNKCIQMRCVALVDPTPIASGAGPSTAADSTAASNAQPQLQFKLASKTYFFHFSSLEQSRIGYDQMSHYATLPYEALYQGYFISISSARQYLALYAGESLASRDPYSKENLEANVDSLKRQIQRGLHQKESLEAYRQLLLLLMLSDDQVTRAPSLEQYMIRSLDECCTSYPASNQPQRRRGGGGSSRAAPVASQSDLLLRVIPNILRILSSMAAEMSDISKELRSTMAIARAWPSRLSTLKAQEEALSRSGSAASAIASPYSAQQGSACDDRAASNRLSRMNTASVRGDTPAGGRRPSAAVVTPSTGTSRRTLRTAEVASETLVWLRTFDMESRLLKQLGDLKKQALACVGRGLFSGFSIMVELIIRDIPDEVPIAVSSRTLPRLQRTVHNVVQLLNAISLTIAHGFLGRCLDVAWAMGRLGMQVATSVERFSNVDVVAMADDGLFIPDWVLDVKALEASQVKSGGLPARLATEGVMLQYCVDTHLDELLASLWLQITKPPMPVNPFPKLMNLIRSHATRMELWRDSMDEALQLQMNDLSLLEQPCFIYAARPSQAALTNIKKLSAGQMLQLDEESWVMYGSYCAAALTDARALQALRATFGEMMESRHWRKGAYVGEVIPALIEDCCLTNAMRLDDMAAWTTAVKAGLFGRKKGILPAAFEHPRFYTVESEEHHLVQGPLRKEAAEAFALDVVEKLEELVSSPKVQHVVHSIQLCWDPSSSSKKLPSNLRPSSALGGSRPGTANLADVQRAKAAAAAAGPSSSSKQQAGPLFTMADCADPARRLLMLDSLVAAAKNVPQGKHVATVRLYLAASKENMYVSVLRHVVFKHAKQPPLLQLSSGMTKPSAMHSDSQGLPMRPNTTEREKLFWDRTVYSRLFFTESAATKWYSWNNERGDPAQPFQYQHIVSEARREMKMLQNEGRVLDMLKLMLLCANAIQDDQGIYQLSRCCLSTAQELNTLMELNTALVNLMDESVEPGSRAAVDNEALRHTFLVYYSRMRRAFNSPKYNYFDGLATIAPKQLDQLHTHVLSNFKLGAKELAMMNALNVWTRACEISVANALLDCFEDSVLSAVGKS
ncbi:hypothetical protein CEUSTIGMA_g8049.t1 [Chlamydomonas eustigma]|uniref:Uncharacterized protein n=1 Tax=Chlamydomonas eustigma TaxID=1157962 RepID=A0A250XC07_9CHLO|nr:hypothetical protein CEUSTIGMA_g8049.t1 [Chlamydomonas eustigma]|eukprot:GAX80614.1 hypothetical protein CEUSTIGMA_g8049.t1 [Chlamydomonas eustigma]